MSELKRQPIHIDPELHRQFKIWCVVHGFSMKVATEEAIREKMDGEKGQNERRRTTSPQDEVETPDAD